MTAQILVAKGQSLESMPESGWRETLAEQVPPLMEQRLAFMSAEHHRVRREAVREIIRTGEPVTPEALVRLADLDHATVERILADLARNLLFLVRNAEGAVSAAFPVSADATPHRLTFSTGERLYGA